MRELPKITATFRLTRPMFLGGANNQFPELRGASIKGMLRFWWRAAAWAHYEELDPLRKQEAEIFGSMHEGRGISVQVAPSSLPNDAAVSWLPNSWQNYTGYGMLESGIRRRARTPFKAAHDFRVILQSTKPALLDDHCLRRALELLGTCGGLGAKSRNGWGSISLIDLVPANGWKMPGSETELRATLERLLRSDAPVPPYTAISRDTQFAVGREFASAEQAHEFVATRYRACVSGPRGSAVKSTPKDLRGQFGLPRNFQNTAVGAGDSKARRAKPLFLHVQQIARSSRTFPLAVYMPGRFLPDLNRLGIPGDGTDVKRFLREIDPSSECL